MEILYKIAGVMFSLSIISFSITFMIFCFQSTIDEYKEAKNKTGYWLTLFLLFLLLLKILKHLKLKVQYIVKA